MRAAATPPLILLLVDARPRRAELMGLKASDVDFDQDVLLVCGKGRRERALPPTNVRIAANGSAASGCRDGTSS